jgi:4-amino-4-deoxy-L-arabinose transferase-like glycosyltransferase
LPPAIRNFVLVFLGALLLNVAGTWTIPLVDRDEPRFSEASREMRERSDYVIPFFNDKYRFDKPAFIYWTQIASYSVFGENDFAARFPSAVAAALTALLLFAWGRRLGGERNGWWAAIIFTLCLQVFVHGKAAVADMWLVFFVTAAHWSGYELLADSLEPARPRADGYQRRLKHWRLVFYMALGLGFLAKGPLGWLPLLTVISTKLFLRNNSLTRRFWFVTGMLGAFAIVCTWGIPAVIRTNGEFFKVGIGRHVVERSFNVMEGHGANSWNTYVAMMPVYFLTVFGSFFPWSIRLPALAKRLWRQRDATDNYLISGILIVFVIMSLVKTKLPHYTLPAFPLLALLTARYVFLLPGWRLPWRTTAWIAVTLLAIIFGLLPLFTALSFLLLSVVAAFALVVLWLVRFLAALPPAQFARRAAIGAAAVSLAVAFVAFPLLSSTFPSAQLYKLSRNDLRPEMDFANVDYAEPSVVWYFRSRCHGFFRGLNPDQLEQFMNFPGPRFVIVPTSVAQAFSAKIRPDWKTYRAQGFTIVHGRPTDLTMILKP